MTRCCPNCGFPLAAAGPYGPDDLNLRLSPQERKVLSRLIQARGGRVDMPQLVEAVYGHQPDGGPDRAHAIVKVRVSTLRSALDGTGWIITKGWEGGHRLIPEQ